MSASYTLGTLLNVPNGDELSFDDSASKLFDFDAYARNMATLNTLSGVSENTLAYTPTVALLGSNLRPLAAGWGPQAPLGYPIGVLHTQRHDIANDTDIYLVQTPYGISPVLLADKKPGAFVYATTSGNAMAGDHRNITGIVTQEGRVLLDIFSSIDHPRGVPARAFCNPDGVAVKSSVETNEMLNVLTWNSAVASGLAAPTFDAEAKTYTMPITVPLVKPPIVTISMHDISGVAKQAIVLDVTALYVNFAFLGDVDDSYVENPLAYSVRAIGVTYMEQ